jgi:hypothetical protein
MNTYPDQLTDCPLFNVCAVTAPQEGSPCGTVPEHMSPLSFAETSCVRAIAGARDIVGSTEVLSPTAEAERTEGLAWSALEMAMVSTDNEAAAGHFDQAEALSYQVWNDPHALLDTRYNTALLNLYLPLFRSRRAGKALQQKHFTHVRQGLAALDTFVHVMPILTAEGLPTANPNDTRAGLSYKTALFLLAGREDIMLFPGSGRERNANYPLQGNRSTSALNGKHDAYMMSEDPDSNNKVPIKVSGKRRTGYGLEVMNISFRAFGRDVIQTLQGSKDSAKPKLASEILYAYKDIAAISAAIPKLAMAEAHGHQLGAIEGLLLAEASYTLRRKIALHQQKINKGTRPSSSTNVNETALRRLVAMGLANADELQRGKT